MLDSTEAPGPRLSLWPRLVGERAPTLWSAEAAERSWAEVELQGMQLRRANRGGDRAYATVGGRSGTPVEATGGGGVLVSLAEVLELLPPVVARKKGELE